jgi:hypothetical protein
MAAGGTMLRLTLAALVSAATAGLLVPLLLGLPSLLGGYPGRWFDLSGALLILSIGIVAGLVVATLPTFFAGAWLWALGDRFGLARLPCAWAAAGASVGAGLWALFVAMTGPGALERILLAVSLAAGAGGALAFRFVMRLTGASPGSRP